MSSKRIFAIAYGIARVQGYVIFVKNGKPGQKLKVKVIQVGARFATATTVVSPTQQGAPQTTSVV